MAVSPVLETTCKGPPAFVITHRSVTDTRLPHSPPTVFLTLRQRPPSFPRRPVTDIVPVPSTVRLPSDAGYRLSLPGVAGFDFGRVWCLSPARHDRDCWSPPLPSPECRLSTESGGIPDSPYAAPQPITVSHQTTVTYIHREWCITDALPTTTQWARQLYNAFQNYSVECSV